MATMEQVRSVMDGIRDRLDDPKMQQKLSGFSRSLQFDFSDLGESFAIRIEDGKVTSLELGGVAAPDMRVTTTSDTLVGIVKGEVNAMSAYMSGRLQADASLPDLLKLQQIL